MIISQPVSSIGVAQDDAHVRPFICTADCKRALRLRNCAIRSWHDLVRLDRIRLGPLQLPAGMDVQAWSSLQGDLAGVLAARREAFA